MRTKRKTKEIEVVEEKRYEKKPTKAMIFAEENKNKYKMILEDGVVMIICKDEKQMDTIKKKIGKQDFSFGFRIDRTV